MSCRTAQQRVTRQAQSKVSHDILSTSTSLGSRPSAPPGPAWGEGKNFFVYVFQGTSYLSYVAPEPGTPGPVERFAGISYPGQDVTVYRLDDGYVVPRTLVSEHNLYNAALQALEEEEKEPEPSSLEPSYPPCGQPPRARSPSPGSPEPESPLLKVWPPQRQGKPYVLVPSDPYVLKAHHLRNQAFQTSGKRTGKGKARYIPTESEESLPEDGNDDDYVLSQDVGQEAHNGDMDISYFESQGPSDSIEDPVLSFRTTGGDKSMDVDGSTTIDEPTNVDESMNVDNLEGNGADVRADVLEADAEGEDHEQGSGSDAVEVPEAWKKGGRPPKAFIKEAAGVGQTYYQKVEHLMKTYKVSRKVVEIATGLQPRVVETRKTSSWNAHQRVYKMQDPKRKEESPGLPSLCRTANHAHFFCS